MKKIIVTVNCRVLSCVPAEKRADGPQTGPQPPWQILFEGVNIRQIPGADPFREQTVEKFKSFVEVQPGQRSLRVEMGSYVNGTQAALYGRVIEEVGVSSAPVIPTQSQKK